MQSRNTGPAGTKTHKYFQLSTDLPVCQALRVIRGYRAHKGLAEGRSAEEFINCDPMPGQKALQC